MTDFHRLDEVGRFAAQQKAHEQRLREHDDLLLADPPEPGWKPSVYKGTKVKAGDVIETPHGDAVVGEILVEKKLKNGLVELVPGGEQRWKLVGPEGAFIVSQTQLDAEYAEVGDD